MRRPRALAIAAVVIATALPLAACGDDEADADDTGSPAASEPTTSTPPTEPASSGSSEPTSEPTESTEEPGDDAVEVDITIADGEIRPLGETVEAEPGQEIRLIVDSDAHDEFHVHSEPEHEFEIVEGENQRFSFTIDDPAVYEMESHELGVVIVKFQIAE
jgi:hypothetical protein